MPPERLEREPRQRHVPHAGSRLRRLHHELAAAIEPEDLEVQIRGDNALIRARTAEFEIGVGEGDEYYFREADRPMALRSESAQEIAHYLSRAVAEKIADHRHSLSRWLESE